jgi:multisubunit Na+/H+ antiporter MnhE subunit
MKITKNGIRETVNVNAIMKIAIKAYLLISLIIFYLINLVKANLAVAIDVVTPRTECDRES